MQQNNLAVREVAARKVAACKVAVCKVAARLRDLVLVGGVLMGVMLAGGVLTGRLLRAADAAVPASSPPMIEPSLVIRPPAREVLRFGESIAACGNRIAITAPTDGDNGPEPGSVSIMCRPTDPSHPSPRRRSAQPAWATTSAAALPWRATVRVESGWRRWERIAPPRSPGALICLNRAHRATGLWPGARAARSPRLGRRLALALAVRWRSRQME